jgi:hypothetical protein
MLCTEHTYWILRAGFYYLPSPESDHLAFPPPADTLGVDQPTAHVSCSMLYLSRISGSGDLVILPSDRHVLQLNRGSPLAIERFCLCYADGLV